MVLLRQPEFLSFLSADPLSDIHFDLRSASFPGSLDAASAGQEHVASIRDRLHYGRFGSPASMPFRCSSRCRLIREPGVGD